jgi:hypothetical protein
MTRSSLTRILWLLVALSLIPAAVLVARRVAAEGTRTTVTMVMDEMALAEHAAVLGRSSLELALHYQRLGLNGIALYEDTFESAAAKGRIAMMTGPEALALALAQGEAPPDIPTSSVLVSEVEPGALEWIRRKNPPGAQEARLFGRTWLVYPGTAVNLRPAGPDMAQVRTFAEAGFDIAYRPRNYPGMMGVGEDFPEEAHYLIHAGLQVAGQPNALTELVAASQGYVTGIIEGTAQDGMPAISDKVPTARLLSFNQDYINQRLHPHDLTDKYLLAANERGVRILYLRPYTEEQLGDMFARTEALVSGLSERLALEGYEVAPLALLDLDYETSALLRGLSAVGILAGLGLLALLYPGSWGPLIAVAVLGLGVLANGLGWGALALAAALAFPVIGFGLLPERLTSLGLATLVSLAGATLLSAVGSDRETMLALTPFAGVAATLVVPPALYLFHYALRYKRPARWVVDLWREPVRLGTVMIALVGAAALALVIVRRGNFPIIGASQAELAFRTWLSDLFVRPRFKELLGHPLAVLGLTERGWPAWLRAGLLTGGVIAQASILNSFSHYHTPFLISLQRTLIALALGLVIGLVLVPLARLAVRLGRAWLEGATREEPRDAQRAPSAEGMRGK